MRQVLLNIPENKFAFFMKLVHSLNFVQVASPEAKKEEYNPTFVAKVQKSETQFEEGKYVSLEKEDLKQFLGL